MALNYQRVGWEDAPSTQTPIDAANLNHMDNGIVALSNEFDRVIPGLEEVAETVSPLLPSMSTMTQDISTLQGQTSALATQAQHILGNFATVEEGETASTNYSTGQHVVLGDYLYKVIDDIAQGESFVENTNIVKTTVGSEIDELNSNFQLFPDVTDILLDHRSAGANDSFTATKPCFCILYGIGGDIKLNTVLLINPLDPANIKYVSLYMKAGDTISFTNMRCLIIGLRGIS